MADGDNNQTKEITIKTETTTRRFKTAEEFQTWSNKQRELYACLGQNKNTHGEHNLRTTLKQNWQPIIDVANQLPGTQGRAGEYNNLVNVLSERFVNGIQGNKIFTEDAFYSSYIQELAKTNQEMAAICLCYFMKHNLVNWDATVHRAVTAAIEFEKGKEGRQEHEDISFQKIKSEWDNTFSEKVNMLDKSGIELENLIKKAREQIGSQEKIYNEKVSGYEQAIQGSFSKTEQELANIQNTYDEKLALQSSVTYWVAQETYHRNKSDQFAKIAALAGLVVLIILSLLAWHYLDADLGSVHLSKIIVFVGVSTFGVWAVKIVANIYMSHLHLATDARERVTMINTYLALLRSDQAPPKEERQLMLQTLFRPSTTGLIKDDHGPANLVDAVSKMTGKGG